MPEGDCGVQRQEWESESTFQGLMFEDCCLGFGWLRCAFCIPRALGQKCDAGVLASEQPGSESEVRRRRTFGHKPCPFAFQIVCALAYSCCANLCIC